MSKNLTHKLIYHNNSRDAHQSPKKQPQKAESPHTAALKNNWKRFFAPPLSRAGTVREEYAKARRAAKGATRSRGYSNFWSRKTPESHKILQNPQNPTPISATSRLRQEPSTNGQRPYKKLCLSLLFEPLQQHPFQMIRIEQREFHAAPIVVFNLKGPDRGK